MVNRITWTRSPWSLPEVVAPPTFMIKCFVTSEKCKEQLYRTCNKLSSFKPQKTCLFLLDRENLFCCTFLGKFSNLNYLKRLPVESDNNSFGYYILGLRKHHCICLFVRMLLLKDSQTENWPQKSYCYGGSRKKNYG